MSSITTNMRRDGKSEIRSPKSERNPNTEVRRLSSAGLTDSAITRWTKADFGFRTSDFFRISGFGLRALALGSYLGVVLTVTAGSGPSSPSPLSLAGKWRFALDRVGTDDARRALAEVRPPADIWLCLPPGPLIEKRLALPLAAERELSRVVAYQMDRETPFAANEVWWSCEIENRDRARGK